MKVGFTGTRNGMTTDQLQSFVRLLRGREVDTFIHGACVGADADAVEVICQSTSRCKIVARPGKSAYGGTNEHYSVEAVKQSTLCFAATTHFARNRDIVNESDLLIATPWQLHRPAKGTGGGTWYTIEYAEKQGEPIEIIWPDGRVERSLGTARLSDEKLQQLQSRFNAKSWNETVEPEDEELNRESK